MQFIPKKINFLIIPSIAHLSLYKSGYNRPVRGTLSTSCYTAVRRTSSASSARRCVELEGASCLHHDGWDGETGSQQLTIRSFVVVLDTS